MHCRRQRVPPPRHRKTLSPSPSCLFQSCRLSEDGWQASLKAGIDFDSHGWICAPPCGRPNTKLLRGIDRAPTPQSIRERNKRKDKPKAPLSFTPSLPTWPEHRSAKYGRPGGSGGHWWHHGLAAAAGMRTRRRRPWNLREASADQLAAGGRGKVVRARWRNAYEPG